MLFLGSLALRGVQDCEDIVWDDILILPYRRGLGGRRKAKPPNVVMRVRCLVMQAND